jgi:hypothetical protein
MKVYIYEAERSLNKSKELANLALRHNFAWLSVKSWAFFAIPIQAHPAFYGIPALISQPSLYPMANEHLCRQTL